jgi:hypothetical protein
VPMNAHHRVGTRRDSFAHTDLHPHACEEEMRECFCWQERIRGKLGKARAKDLVATRGIELGCRK